MGPECVTFRRSPPVAFQLLVNAVIVHVDSKFPITRPDHGRD
jgi:hypothetical protein